MGLPIDHSEKKISQEPGVAGEKTGSPNFGSFRKLTSLAKNPLKEKEIKTSKTAKGAFG